MPLTSISGFITDKLYDLRLHFMAVLRASRNAAVAKTGGKGLKDAPCHPPDVAGAASCRKAPDFLPAYNDGLLLCDVLGGILLGYLTGCCYVLFGHQGLSIYAIIGPMLREVMLGSIIAALILREPRLAIAGELFAPRRIFAAMVVRAVAAISILLAIGLATRGFGDMARLWLLGWCVTYLLSACISRAVILTYLHRLAMSGALREAVAVIGAPDVAGRLATRLAEGAAIVRVFDDADEFDFGEPLSSSMAELLELARAGEIDTVVLAFNAADSVDAEPIVQHLKSMPIQVTICSNVDAPATTRRKLRLLSSVPMSVVADRPLKHWDLIAKSAMDKAGAIILLILIAPFMLFVALAVACDSRGPVIFHQRRSGWGGRVFTIYKFRTMWHEIGAAAGHQTIRNDPRCTRIGAILRRNSIDEMPQLWNVLRGEMSLVGPRPHADVLHAAERAGCTVVAEYAQRHRVKPGLTGWAQIHGSRGAVPNTEALRQRIAYDLYYIDNWSIWLDLAILVRTPWVLLTGENAY